MAKVTRRSFVTTVGAASVASATALLTAPTQAASDGAPAASSGVPVPSGGAPATAKISSGATPVYLFFNADEARFIEAACERLIPADELGPGALLAAAPNYLDKQLGGAWARASAYTAAGLGLQEPPRKVINCPSHRRNCSILRCALLFATWMRARRPFMQCRQTIRMRISNPSRQARTIWTASPRLFSSMRCCK